MTEQKTNGTKAPTLQLHIRPLQPALTTPDERESAKKLVVVTNI